jgi:hypothetical protein
VTSRPVSIGDLTRLGSDRLDHLLDRSHPPATTLEWLGIAVANIPELWAAARTADEVHWRSRTQSAELRGSLLDAFMEALGVAAAMVDQAREQLLARHADVDADDDPDSYAAMIEMAHRSAPRRAEMMIGGYASFLGAAIEAAGALADGELADARRGRWERTHTGDLVAVRAAQLQSALANALGGLLAYARLVAEDSRRIED